MAFEEPVLFALEPTRYSRSLTITSFPGLLAIVVAQSEKEINCKWQDFIYICVILR
jgi:hypothetical protein